MKVYWVDTRKQLTLFLGRVAKTDATEDPRTLLQPTHVGTRQNHASDVNKLDAQTEVA